MTTREAEASTTSGSATVFSTRAHTRRALVCLLTVAASLAAVSPSRGQPAAGADRTEGLKVFLDCPAKCDEDFLRTEITVISYVRDRQDADVHILVTSQPTGGG